MRAARHVAGVPADAILVLVSRADPASTNIRDALLDAGGWDDAGSFRGLPVRRNGAFLMAEISDMHIEADGIDAAMKAAGIRFDSMLVASRHRAASGKPALTVHPIGNFGEAEVGGKARTLVPSAPLLMSRVLRRLSAEAKGLRHEVTFEATHHGPCLDTPTAFVEIGTDEDAWNDPDLGRRVARSIMAAAEPSIGDAAPTLVMLGGSHYAPRATDLVRRSKANFGHIVPGYALDAGLHERLLYEAVRLTPGCQGYYADPRSMTKPPDVALQVFGALELGWWTEQELSPGGEG